jgi:hypothetical protein
MQGAATAEKFWEVEISCHLIGGFVVFWERQTERLLKRIASAMRAVSISTWNPLAEGTDMRTKIATAVIFLCAASSIVSLLLKLPRNSGEGSIAVVASAFGLVAASAALFLRPRLSYYVGIVSGLAALHWFSQIEFWHFPVLNAWVAFNLPAGNPYFVADIFLAKLRILFAVTVVASTACAVTRLLPAGWVVRKNPIRDRTWPALAVCFLVIAAWYALSASPYRIPLIVDGVSPELTVLHVEKRGIQFHEVSITVYRDRKLYIQKNDRRLFHYRFPVRSEVGVLPEATATRVFVLAQSSQLRDLPTPPAVVLRHHNAEGWYIRTGQGVLAFTTEYGTEPPREVVDLFHDLESLAPAEQELRTMSDVCMGFCYDPLAGLGLVNINDRCRERNGTRCK